MYPPVHCCLSHFERTYAGENPINIAQQVQLTEVQRGIHARNYAPPDLGKAVVELGGTVERGAVDARIDVVRHGVQARPFLSS